LLPEKLCGAQKAEGKQGDQAALCARAMRTVKLCSLDARNEGQSDHSHDSCDPARSGLIGFNMLFIEKLVQ
jgi:hypothetical protein